MHGGGERLPANGGYLPARDVYGLPLETSNDIMPSVAVISSRRSRERERGKFAFFPLPLLPLRPPTPVQAAFEERSVRRVILWHSSLDLAFGG